MVAGAAAALVDQALVSVSQVAVVAVCLIRTLRALVEDAAVVQHHHLPVVVVEEMVPQAQVRKVMVVGQAAVVQVAVVEVF